MINVPKTLPTTQRPPLRTALLLAALPFAAMGCQRNAQPAPLPAVELHADAAMPTPAAPAQPAAALPAPTTRTAAEREEFKRQILEALSKNTRIDCGFGWAPTGTDEDQDFGALFADGADAHAATDAAP